MKLVGMTLHQFRYDARAFSRDPTAVFFTGFLPLMFLVLFVGVFGNEDVPIGRGRSVSGATYYVPSILALAVISATAMNLAISLATMRERGTLKRMRSTPLPPAAFLAARVLTQVVTIVVIAVVIVLFGRFVYDVRVPAPSWPAFLVTLVVGIVSFCCVGFLMTLPVRSEQSAPALMQALVLPLQFMSGVFFPRGTVPEWMLDLAALFPIKHLVDAMFVVFDPRHTGSRFAVDNLLVLAAWGLTSLVLAARYFRWTPTNR